jgi:hypothetical protein
MLNMSNSNKKLSNIIMGLNLFDWQGRILSNILFVFWAMEFQEKVFLRFTDRMSNKQDRVKRVFKTTRIMPACL